MTETSSGSAARGGKSARKGLTMQRIHTRDGVHPYDDVTWERRDVVMTNWRDGSINFEQRGVEFPDFWSVNAANIVTTKYFRGAIGSPQREGHHGAEDGRHDRRCDADPQAQAERVTDARGATGVGPSVRGT